MSVVLLVSDRGAATYVTPWRVRLRDRVAARVRAFGLDAALARGVAPESSAPLELRAETLIGPTARQELGDHVQQLLRRARSGCRFSIHAAPISRRLVSDAEPELSRLALRLLDGWPVDVRGVASVRGLLCDGCGPLYAHPYEGDASELRSAVNEAIDALEIHA
jgi:hypothetical protein